MTAAGKFYLTTHYPFATCSVYAATYLCPRIIRQRQRLSNKLGGLGFCLVANTTRRRSEIVSNFTGPDNG